MKLKALTKWNHHSPGKNLLVVLPGDTITVKDSVGRYMVKENWAVEVEEE